MRSNGGATILKTTIATVLHFAARFSAPHEYVASRINRGTKRAESVDVTISPSPWKKNVKFRRCGECHGAEYAVDVDVAHTWKRPTTTNI